MLYKDQVNLLRALGFSVTGNHHPEGETYTNDIEEIKIHVCPLYQFVETWRHEGFSGKRIWYKSLSELETTIKTIK